MALRAVIFDCFGVLLGDVLLHKEADLRAAGENDKAEQLGAIMRRMDRGLLTAADALKEESELLGLSEAELVALFARGEVLNESLVPIIRRVHTQYKTGLLSNIGARSQIERRMPEGLLDELFDAVVVSGEVGSVKPEPRIYEVMLEKLGVNANEAIMIDDQLAYCQGAEAVGVRAIQFTDTAQLEREFAELEKEFGA